MSAGCGHPSPRRWRPELPTTRTRQTAGPRRWSDAAAASGRVAPGKARPLDREVIPERRVHAKGLQAPTAPLPSRDRSRKQLHQGIGVRQRRQAGLPIFASPVFPRWRARGSGTGRCRARRCAVSRSGSGRLNWDVVGNNTPVFAGSTHDLR
ncbi:hypothetical protein ACU4GD_35530 [Cupriavidus basilensis]